MHLHHVHVRRSKGFRPAYGRIHEVRALVPQGVPCLACRATVTRSVWEEVKQNLDMFDCDFVCASPDHPNIYIRRVLICMHISTMNLETAHTIH